MQSLGPHSSKATDALGSDAKIAAKPNQRLLDAPHKLDGTDARRESAQIKNGISNQLPWSVKRYIAPAIALKKRDTFFLQKIVRRQQILLAVIAAEGDNWRMFE